MSLDSTPVACIPAGNIVKANETAVSTKYDLQNRRIFITHISPDSGKVVEGWASVQSTEGYIILSPVLNLCYSNSRWGSTRPLILQCGHAAHLGCVETHVASIHQKAQDDTPYDGRFAADIDDGEFLCPLCKQLCNVVVPGESLGNGSKTDDEEMAVSLPTAQSSEQIQISDEIERLRKSLASHSSGKLSTSEEKKGVKQYGKYLEHSMKVFSWGNKEKRMEQWHQAVRNWDFKENEDDAYFNEEDQSGDPLVSDILLLLRQQHIAWAAAGHTASAAESSARGIKKSGFEPPTSDPWTDFDSSSKDSHSMVIELRRTLSAASSLQTFLNDEINEKLEKTKTVESENSNFAIVGHLLGDILNGECWASQSEMGNAGSDDWSVLTALLSSLPCHVSKDETLSLRQEARAAAAQMWIIKATSPQGAISNMEGASYSKMNAAPPLSLNDAGGDATAASQLWDATGKMPKSKNESEILSSQLPPTPLSVRKIPDCEKLRKGWGSMRPSDIIGSKGIIFRPALASGFLYLPLLSWDLTSFAGAIFSSLLSSDKVQCQDLFGAARILMMSRMVQVLVSLREFASSGDDEIAHFEADIDVSKESSSVVDLLNHLKVAIRSETKPLSHGDETDKRLLAFVSSAVLPFARTLVLLLRASTSSIRLLSKNVRGSIVDFLENEETMYIEDGIYFMKELGCPMPSEIMVALESGHSTNGEMSDLAGLINRWVRALVTLDTYHGSYGDHLEFNTDGQRLIQRTMKRNHTAKQVSMKKKDDIDPSHSDENGIQMEVSAASSHEDDDEVMHEDAEHNAGFFGANFGGRGDVPIGFDDSTDEEMEHVNDDFDEIEMDSFGINFFGMPPLSNDSVEEQPDSNDQSIASIYSWDHHEESSPADQRLAKQVDDHYANISTSAIIPFQASFLGNKEPGPGPRGGSLDNVVASTIMHDASHLGLIHRPGKYKRCYFLIFVLKLKNSIIFLKLLHRRDQGSSGSLLHLLSSTVL